MLVLKFGKVVNIVIYDYVKVLFRLMSGNVIFSESLRHGGGVVGDLLCDVGEMGGQVEEGDDTGRGRGGVKSNKGDEEGVIRCISREN